MPVVGADPHLGASAEKSGAYHVSSALPASLPGAGNVPPAPAQKGGATDVLVAVKPPAQDGMRDPSAAGPVERSGDLEGESVLVPSVPSEKGRPTASTPVQKAACAAAPSTARDDGNGLIVEIDSFEVADSRSAQVKTRGKTDVEDTERREREDVRTSLKPTTRAESSTPKTLPVKPVRRGSAGSSSAGRRSTPSAPPAHRVLEDEEEEEEEEQFEGNSVRDERDAVIVPAGGEREFSRI